MISMPLFDLINELGIMICTIIVVSMTLILIQLLYIGFKKNETIRKLVKTVKNKLMWSSPLRMIVQGYFIQIYAELANANN